MAKNDKSADAKPIADVAHPGKSAPSGNSKSVIVSSRPLLKDPMVVTDNAAKMPDKESTKGSSAKIKGPDIPGLQSATAPLLETEASAESAPPTNPELEPEPEPEPEPEAKLKPKPEKVVKPDPAASPAVEPDTDQPATPAPDGGDDSKPETAADDAESQTPAKGSAQQLEAEAAAQAQHQAAVDKLADSKQDYLPIVTVEKRRSRRFVAAGIILSLLLAVAWADIALDAGLIQIHGLKPITHFFSS